MASLKPFNSWMMVVVRVPMRLVCYRLWFGVRNLKWRSIRHFGRDIGLSSRDIGACQAVSVAAGLCRRGDGLHGKHAPDIMGQGVQKCHGEHLCLPSDGDSVKAVIADACVHPFDRLDRKSVV